MKPRYSFSSRMSRRARDSPKMRKQKEKYPALVEKIIQQSDIILEVLDARFAKETQNTEIENLIQKQNKKLLKVLNKSDLLKSIPKNKLAISCKKRRGIKKLRDIIKKEANKINRQATSQNAIQQEISLQQIGERPRRERSWVSNRAGERFRGRSIASTELRAKSGVGAKKFHANLKDTNKIKNANTKKFPKKSNHNKNQITVGIIGYPNTGKSSLINLLIGKRSAGTGADAGFTKGIQKLKLSKDIILLDTPGVIPQKDYSSYEKDKIAKHAIVSGRSYSQVKEPDMAISKIMKDYPQLLEKHYKINADGDSEILLEKLGRRLNLLKKKGEVDADKVARRVLREWQRGEIRV